mgnify:CR=1 FL=1
MRRRDLAVIGLLFALPLIMFWAQTVGGRTLLPAENLYQYEPYAAYREQLGVPAVPHNHLLSDLVLQNMQWKAFIRESFALGEVPLWNPHQFSGIAFLAAGQQSTLYPFSVLYYMLPLSAAYGWFTVIQLWLAGVLMYGFARFGLGISRTGGAAAGVIYQLSAFFVISAVFPMIIAAAAWLPLILWMIEWIVRGKRIILALIVGAIALGCEILAGHVEITYYTLIIAAYYAAARLLWLGLTTSPQNENLTPNPSPKGEGLQQPADLLLASRQGGWGGRLRLVVGRGLLLLGMVLLGVALGAVQFIPTFEAASGNFRSESASLQQVLDWAHPKRDVIQFLLPNFYGSPAQHGYVDVFANQYVDLTAQEVISAAGARITRVDWGLKNYVEGALYVGILPLVLAAFAILLSLTPKRFVGTRNGASDNLTPQPPLRKEERGSHPARWTFALLALVALTFMFGLPTYALLYYGFPGISQLHSPFRWVFALTLCVAVLAGFGLDDLLSGVAAKWARRIGITLLGLGVLIGAALLLGRSLYPQIEPTLERLWTGLALAPNAFRDTRMFFSVQFVNVLILAVMLVGAGAVFVFANRNLTPKSTSPLNPLSQGRGDLQGDSLPPLSSRRGERGVRFVRPIELFAVLLIAADLMIASWGFNPASDPAWLDFTPPAIEWLQAQPGDWRYTTYEDPTNATSHLLNANMTLRYGLEDIRGYESIIPKTYFDFMELMIAPQVQRDYNRVAPIYTVYGDGFDPRQALASPYLDLLNVRYVVSYKQTDMSNIPGFDLAYEDDAVRIWENTDALPRTFLLTEIPRTSLDPIVQNRMFTPVEITRDTGREFFVDVSSDQASWLVVSQSYDPGWRAYVRPRGADENTESVLSVEPIYGALQMVRLQPGDWTVRLVYSPASFQIGLFASFISGIILLLIAGVGAWRRFVGQSEGTGVQRIARNSLAPILLNLFNRGIDMAFALVMLRILGPNDAGLYFYAGVIFIWFDIFTNFGLNLYLTREVARDRSKAGYLFFNTSALRIGLALLGVPLLLGFLGVRQSTVSPPLDMTAVVAIGLLYIGLLPNSLSTGLTSLYYAFERAEVPAAVATVATICKSVFGLAALLLGWGIIGLAGVSIATNVITLAILAWNGRALYAGMIRRVERPLMRRMLGESYPLMFNHFLATIFFQIDVVLIEAIHNPTMVGQYSVAYKWVSALNVIPSFFTQALLPVMSRQAHEDRAALKRMYTLAIKLLVSVALPTAVIFTFAAEFLAGVLGGAQYLPDGAIATQLMIWSIPIGWMNSLTQYVLIALDLQKRITTAFVLGVGFNIIANLILIPQYGYRAAALTTIASEAVLLVPFALLLQGSIGRLNWLDMLWRPLVAALIMLAVTGALWSVLPLGALIAGAVVYVVVLMGLRPLNADEQARLGPLLPGRVRRVLRVGA